MRGSDIVPTTFVNADVVPSVRVAGHNVGLCSNFSTPLLETNNDAALDGIGMGHVGDFSRAGVNVGSDYVLGEMEQSDVRALAEDVDRLSTDEVLSRKDIAVSRSEVRSLQSPQVVFSLGAREAQEEGVDGNRGRIEGKRASLDVVGVRVSEHSAPPLLEESLFGVPLLWDGTGSESPLMMNREKELYGVGCARSKSVKVKDLNSVMGTSFDIQTAVLTPRPKTGLAVGRNVSGDNVLNESNLVVGQRN